MKPLALICSRHRLVTVLAWVALVAGLATAAVLNPGTTSNDYSVPGAPSERAATFLQDHDLDNPNAQTAQVVFQADDGLASHDDALAAYARDLAAANPTWEIRPGSPQANGLSEISDDGTIGYLDITVADSALSAEDAEAAAAALTDAAPSKDGLTVEFAGEVFPEPSGGPGEGLGMLAAVVILLIAFGSLFAMAIPVAVAAFGASAGVLALTSAAHVVDLPGAAAALSLMLAVGVGIDYSLLVVTRYREVLGQGGRTPREAVVEAMDTAGRSVLVAGATVVVAVLGLLVMNMPMVNGIAIGAALAIGMTMLAAITLLPALLAIVGHRIDRFGLPHKRFRAQEATDVELDRGGFAAWARTVQRFKVPAALGSLALMLALSVPALDMRLGFPNTAAGLPTDNTQRRAHDLVTEGFGPGSHGPLVLAIDTAGVSGPAEDKALAELATTIKAVDGVQQVEGPFTSDDGAAAAAIVVPTTGPDDAATADLVKRLREDVLPGAAMPGSTQAPEVTGTTAASVDFSEYVQERLPLFVGVVLAVAFMLLAWTYRSVLVPLKAVAMNLVSITAAFGVTVAVAQWGWGAELIGLEPGPVVAWVPMMLVAVVFGLSMDYEVFLLSRIKEHVDAGDENSVAVTRGLAATGRVITAAAAIMVCVFGGFVLGADPQLKVFGLGLAVAVLLDATVVRMLLVPATMVLLGSANWWAPSWMRRRVPAAGGAPGEVAGEVAAPVTQGAGVPISA